MISPASPAWRLDPLAAMISFSKVRSALSMGCSSPGKIMSFFRCFATVFAMKEAFSGDCGYGSTCYLIWRSLFHANIAASDLVL